MEESNRSLRGVRFGVFEVDLRSGELRKQGLKIKLQGQPIQILALLLERPGELVTREELKEKLWPTDTFVDFEHGLNAAVKKLRAALEDSADNPRFVETLHRRGYRFIAPVEELGQARRAGVAPEVPAALAHRVRFQARWIAALAGLALVAGLITLRGFWRESQPGAQPIMRFTISLPSSEAIVPSGSLKLALSPDGTQLVYAARRGDNRQLYLRPIDQIQATPISGTNGAGNPFFSPDGQWVGFIAEGKLKKVSLHGGPPVTLCELRGGTTWGSIGGASCGGPMTRLSSHWGPVQASGESRPRGVRPRL